MSEPRVPDPAAEDLYVRLGVAPDASPDALRTGYRDAVRRFPPERDAEAFKRVREAFETLDDPDARARYDLQRDEDSPTGLLARAEHAMGERDYANAAHYFKRVLLEDPGAMRARNLLGLCLLYQGESAAAAVQYDRLLQHPEPATIWLLNAGHAYREAGRPSDALRVLALADARPDADHADVGVAIADVAIDAHDYRRAHAAIREGLRRHAPDTPGAVLLLLRRLDITLHAHEDREYHTTLAQIEQVARAAQFAQQAAYRLGIAAWKLIDARAFRLALPAAHAAERLQPEDVDYDALSATARALGAHQIAAARHTVRTHVAFSGGRWLHPLGPRVLAYCDEHAAYEGMRPVSRIPSLGVFWSGFGTRLVGRVDADERTHTYVSTLYLLALFLPIVPVRRYRVRDAERSGRTFIGVLPLTPPQRVQQRIALGVLAVLALWLAIAGLQR